MTDEDQWPRQAKCRRDSKGRFVYEDYDGEEVLIGRTRNGDVWMDKRGEGPVFIDKRDIHLIVKAMEGK